MSLLSTVSSSSNISAASPSSSSALYPGAIAGIVIGAIVGAALVALASSLISRRGMHKSRDSKQADAVGQMGFQGHQDYRYGLAVRSELPGLGMQRHQMQGTQSQTQMTEMQGMDARELSESAEATGHIETGRYALSSGYRRGFSVQQTPYILVLFVSIDILVGICWCFRGLALRPWSKALGAQHAWCADGSHFQSWEHTRPTSTVNKTAAGETQELYVGKYSSASKSKNSSMTLKLDGLYGLVVSSFTLNGKDNRPAVAELNNMKPENLDFSLYPTTLQVDSKDKTRLA